MEKVVLITGTSSGFGRETAAILADKGCKVYGTVRKTGVPQGKVKLLEMDLTDHGSIKEAVRSIIEKEGRIDVLINNAGMHIGGPAETTPPEHVRLLIDTNFIGMVTLTQEVLPVMRSQGSGMIINFSSIGGLMGLPFQSFYSAGKFAIEGFSEALRLEVKRFGIKVVIIEPGDFHTNNTANRRKFLTPVLPGDPYGHFNDSLAVIEKDETGGRDPSIMGRKIARIIDIKDPSHCYVVASFEQKLAVLLYKLLPGKLFMKILAGHYRT